ncbi:hypothetical protein SNEBB_008744 [Seison nebaliae]|nr:hypothetical protein SNEBB_008744 [Seison nebaliae]
MFFSIQFILSIILFLIILSTFTLVQCVQCLRIRRKQKTIKEEESQEEHLESHGTVVPLSSRPPPEVMYEYEYIYAEVTLTPTTTTHTDSENGEDLEVLNSFLERNSIDYNELDESQLGRVKKWILNAVDSRPWHDPYK